MEEPHDNLDRFRAIFDLCDEDKDGYIDVDHFKELAHDHFGAEGIDQEGITGVINLLDPEGRGLISFEDFCRGVEQIIDIQNQAQASRIKASVSVDTLVPLDIAGDLSALQDTLTPTTPPSQSPFAGYDLSGLENLSGSSNNNNNNQNHQDLNNSSSLVSDFSGLGTVGGSGSLLENGLLVPQFNNSSVIVPSISEDDGDSAISGRSSEINESSRPEITDEENYEDYGEVESEADVSDQGLTPVIPRKRGDKKDLLSRSHKKACPNRRLLTTAALASQLQRSSREVTPNSTRRSSYGSDEIFEDIDGNFQDLNGRVKFLENQLLRLTESQVDTSTKQSKLKEENSTLVNKVIYLEEQIRDMELRADERLTTERRKHQELMARREREKSDEVDYVTSKLHRVEEDYEALKDEASKMRHEINKLRSEKIELQEKMLEKQEMYNMLYDDNERLKGEYHRQEELHQRERQSMGQLLDELGKELEELRKYKIEVETGVRSSRGSISELPGRYQELQGEIHKLKEENRDLQSSNDDLNAQLMNRCVEEGKSLLKDCASQSLAQELEHLTKEELMQQLRQEQDFSLRLKQYVDRIIITILEKNPSLLEIKGMQA